MWCVKWLSQEEAAAQAAGQNQRGGGPWDLTKLGNSFHETWLAYVTAEELRELTFDARQKIAMGGIVTVG